VDSLVLLQHSAPVERVKNNMRIGMIIAVNIKIMVFWDSMPWQRRQQSDGFHIIMVI
jgi:hypothetical protein